MAEEPQECYKLCIKSVTTQILPPITHGCIPESGPISDYTVAWYEQIGNYLNWSCPKCTCFIIFSAEVLANNSARKLRGEKLGDNDLRFVGLNEWLSTQGDVSREEFIKFVNK